MDIKYIYRIILDVVIVACVIQGWWFIALPLSLVGLLSFASFIEIIIAGIMFDSLFGFVRGSGWWGYAGTSICVLLFCVITFVRGKMRK